MEKFIPKAFGERVLEAMSGSTPFEEYVAKTWPIYEIGQRLIYTGDDEPTMELAEGHLTVGWEYVVVARSMTDVAVVCDDGYQRYVRGRVFRPYEGLRDAVQKVLRGAGQ